MCAPSPPKAPDYRAAAEEQGQQNLEAARATGRMNNPNVVSPYGTQNVVWNGDQPTVTQAFSPEQQGLYDRQVQTQGLLGDLGVRGATSLGDVIGQNLDLSSAPPAPGDASATRDQVIKAMMGRVDSDIGEQRDNANSSLVAAGIRPGTEAYDREMTRLDRTRTDALQQAQIAAGGEASRDFGMDAERRRTAIAEILAQRQTPLNEITALTSGSQVSNPFAQAPVYNGGAAVAAAPMFQAAQAQGQADMDAYNAQAGMYGGMMSGLFGLGGAGIKKWG